jgi:hypothetical protein
MDHPARADPRPAGWEREREDRLQRQASLGAELHDGAARAPHRLIGSAAADVPVHPARLRPPDQTVR